MTPEKILNIKEYFLGLTLTKIQKNFTFYPINSSQKSNKSNNEADTPKRLSTAIHNSPSTATSYYVGWRAKSPANVVSFQPVAT